MAALILTIPATLLAADYNIDSSHSEVTFKIRHMGIGKVSGRFDQFEGTFSYDPENPAKSLAHATIQLASVDTDNEDRDAHLKNPDFFDVENYPEMSFHGHKVTDADEVGFKLHGELSLHGETRPVVLDVELNGLVTDPWGNGRAGFTATTKIDRKDFGLTWTKNLGTGELMVGDMVAITLEIEGIAIK
ncbi:polyisoprenoid-binding protein [bacterium]|nr:polyisoprenoid-binding protein [bacterium]